MTSQPTEVLQPERRRPRRAPWVLGVIGVILAVSAGVLQVLGIIQATGLNWSRGTLLAWLAIGVSAGAFLVGLAAVILNRGRRWGVIAMIAAVFANPWVLTQLLNALA